MVDALSPKPHPSPLSTASCADLPWPCCGAQLYFDHTLQTTALVPEAYLRIGNNPTLVGASRASVFRVASKVKTANNYPTWGRAKARAQVGSERSVSSITAFRSPSSRGALQDPVR